MHSSYVRRANTAFPSSLRRISAFYHPGVIFCIGLASFGLAATSQAQTLPTSVPARPLDLLPGQPKVAAISIGPGTVVNARRHKIVFEQIGVQSLQVVSVALQYPVALAGTIVAAEPLDGGRIVSSGQPLAVAADGTLNFSYEAGANRGCIGFSDGE